ncbi:MAG: rRNA maturation RNase YbeY [Treponema sp.]|nr:rRNA maturation RNase YbeY [Treponema sp.]
MNNVIINAETLTLPSWSGSAGGFALKVLDEIKRENWELSILFCNNEKIRELNAQYRNKDESTDILSFNLGETIKDGNNTIYLPGDIIISLDTLQENALYFNIPEDEELRRLIIHGILHLDGMDHKTLDINEPMLALQEDILNRLKDESIIPFDNQNAAGKKTISCGGYK